MPRPYGKTPAGLIVMLRASAASLLREGWDITTMAKKGNKFAKYVARAMDTNERFFEGQAREAWEEIVDFTNDAIGYVKHQFELPDAKTPSARAMPFFTCHVLMPGCYSICVNLLAGGLPACYHELRLILESLAKCYLADCHYSGQSSFVERLELLQGDNKREHEFLEEFGDRIGRKDSTRKLWGKLSQQVHTHGYIDRIVRNIVESDHFPGYALAIPTDYAAEDRDDLNELHKYIREVRSLVKSAMEIMPTSPSSPRSRPG